MAIVKKRIFGKNKDKECWIVDYYDQHKKRHIKTFPNKKAAEAWKVGAQHEIRQGVHTAASDSQTLEQVWELWLEKCEADRLEYATTRQRRQHLDHHIKGRIGHLKLSALTQPLLYEFDDQLRNKGRSVAMRRKIMTSIKTCLGYAMGRGYVSQNVARGVRIKKDEREDTSGPLRAGVDFPSRPELNVLMDKAERRWRPFIITAIFTGMRQSELRGLVWSNVDLDKGVIHVRQRADLRNKIGSPKSKAGKRDIPLAPSVTNALRQWKLACPPNELGLVFPTGGGTVMRMCTVFMAWSGLLERCGLPHYKFHALRHAAASLFIEHLGWSAKRIQTVMGHASVTMTFDRYGHLMEDLAASAEDMAKLEAAVRAT